MAPYILYLTIDVRIPWQCTLKERRQQAQKTRDLVKNKFNATVKLDYPENNQLYTLYFIALGESADYLQKQIESLYQFMDDSGSLHYTFDVHIEPW